MKYIFIKNLKCFKYIKLLSWPFKGRFGCFVLGQITRLFCPAVFHAMRFGCCSAEWVRAAVANDPKWSPEKVVPIVIRESPTNVEGDWFT